MPKIGIISDTHGMLRPEIAAVFAGVERIIHAGDIGALLVMLELNKIAPVTAVYGNTDKALWCRDLPASAVVTVGDVNLYVLHNLDELDIDPEAAGFAAVIYGHSHQQIQETHGGVLYFNPGSAGQRRYCLPASVGVITIENSHIHGEIISLPETEPARTGRRY
jgi:putative phosphoesterase